MRKSFTDPFISPPSLKFLRCSQRLASLFTGIYEGIQSAIFMGLIDDSIFQHWDSYPYHESPDESTNLGDLNDGFEDWERELVENCASHHGSTLVIGAGGGREALALKKRGAHVESIEYNFQLAMSTDAALKKLGVEIPLWHEPRFQIPEPDEAYDTVFVARLYLSYIHDRNRRIEFLKRVRSVLKDDGVLIFGYFIRPENARTNLSRSFRFQAVLANLIRRIRGKIKQFPVEVGDHLDPHIPLYHHHFIEQEITAELHEAGFRVLESGHSWFGWTAAGPAEISQSHPGNSK